MKIFTLLSLLLLIACNQESTTEKENTESTVPTVEKKLDAEIKEIDPLKNDLEKIKLKIEAKEIVDKTDEIEAPVHKKELIRKGWKLQSAKCQFCNGTGYGWS